MTETTTDILTPKGLACEKSDSYLSLSKNRSSNKKVNKKFITFFKHWYFDITPISEGNKQVRKDNHSCLLVLASYNLENKKAEPLLPDLATLYRVLATSAKDSAAVDFKFHHALTFKSALAETILQEAKKPVRSIKFKSARAKNAVSKWGGFSSLMLTPPYATFACSGRLPEALPTGGNGLSFSTRGKGLSFKPESHRGGLTNTKLYLQNTLRGDWFLLKKVTDLKKCLTTFVNQANNPAVKLSDKKLNARGLEAKTTNINSILSFWLLSFVAFIIRLKLENPDLNLFLAHYPFGVSSVAGMIVPQNTNVTPKGIEVSKIKAVLLLPKTGNNNNPVLTLDVPPIYGRGLKRHNPHSRMRSINWTSGSRAWLPDPYYPTYGRGIYPYPRRMHSAYGTGGGYAECIRLAGHWLGVDGSHMLTAGSMACTAYGSGMGVKGVMHEHLQHILLTASYPYGDKKQNNQFEPGLHPLIPKVETLSNYTKVSKLPLSPLGIKKRRLDPYYGYSFFRVTPTPHYLTMLSKDSMPNHQYNKKISQEDYLLFKKSQEKSLFFKSPGVMGLRSKLVPALLAYNGTYFHTPCLPQGTLRVNHSNTTQTTKIYIKASYLLNNLVKAQTFNNGYCFSYLAPVTKITPNFNKQSQEKKTFKKRVKKNKMSIKYPKGGKETSVYNFIANGLAAVSVPNVLYYPPSRMQNAYGMGEEVLVDKKQGLYLATYTKEIVRIHATHQATPSIVSNRDPNVWGPTKLIESTPGLIVSAGDHATHDHHVINPDVSLERTSAPSLSLGIIEGGTNKTNVFTHIPDRESGRLEIMGIKSENLFGVLSPPALLLGAPSQGGWSCFKLDTPKGRKHKSNLLPLTSYVEGIFFASDAWRGQPDSRMQNAYGSGMGVKRLGGVSTPKGKATTLKMQKQAPFTYSKGLVKDTLQALLFRAASFFQTLLWDINIYNVLWLKSLIIKNIDLNFKNHLYDKDYLRPSDTLLLTPNEECLAALRQSPSLLKVKKSNYALVFEDTKTKTGSVGMKVEKNRSPQHKPDGARFVEGKKAGNTKLLRSFMLLMNHKKLQAKKKLTPFSISLEQSFKEALSSKAGKILSTVYEMRKLEKQEYRAQKENIEVLSVRPKKRKRFYPRPDWLRVRLYETLLTPPSGSIAYGCRTPANTPKGSIRAMKPNHAFRMRRGYKTRMMRQEKNASSSLSLKKTRGGFREKRSMPFYLRSSNGWGGPKNSLLLPSPTPKGVRGTTLDRGNLISNFQALFTYNPFTLDEVQVKNNINQKYATVHQRYTIGSSDSPNILNNNLFRVWFFNNFYNFDSSNFLEVNNLSMLRIFWCLNQTNVCSINSFKDTKPNPEIWLNTFSHASHAGFAIDAKKKAGLSHADYVFKGFTPFTSHIRKMSPTQIRSRFASSKIHPSLLASSGIHMQNAYETSRGANPSFSWKACMLPGLDYLKIAKVSINNENNEHATHVHKDMQTSTTKSPHLTGRLSSFFHDPMLPPLNQGEKKQAQKKKRRKEVEGNEVPHIEENPVFNNRNDVWWNQKPRQLAENNKTKNLIRELSIKISNLTLPWTGPVCILHAAAESPEGTGSMGLLTVLRTEKERLIFNLTKYRQKQQKLNYLGFIPYSFEQSKGLNMTSQSRTHSAYAGSAWEKTRFNMAWTPHPYGVDSGRPTVGHLKYKNSIFEKKRLSPFYTSSALIRQSTVPFPDTSPHGMLCMPGYGNKGSIREEYALGKKKQMFDKKATSKFWWLKNTSFKALYAQHRVPHSGKTGNANSTNHKGFLTTSQVINKAEATTMLHVMHGRTGRALATGRDLVHSSPYCKNNENKPLPLLTWLTSLSQPSPIVFSTVRTGYTTSSSLNTPMGVWAVSATSNLTKPRAAGLRSWMEYHIHEEPILISLFSMATTVFFHFCCLIGLLSISQVRCAIKFYFILFYKLSKSYIQLISSLYEWTFQYPLSFLKQHSLSHDYPGFATVGRVNAFFKYSKGLVLGCATKSFTVGYLHTSPTIGRVPSHAMLPGSYLQIGESIVSASNLLRSRLRCNIPSDSPSGSMKNSAWLHGWNITPMSYKILVWLNKRVVFLLARIYPPGDKEESVLPEPLSWEGKKEELKILPTLTSFFFSPLGRGTGKAELALYNKFFVLFFSLSKQPLKGHIKQLFGLQLEIEFLNAKNMVSFIRTNSIKTTLTVLKKSRFLVIRSVSLLVFFLQDCFEAVLRFFENPTELSLDFFAYTFLVELYSDSLSIMPEVMDLTIWNWFQKTTGSLKTSLFFGNLLQRRFFCFFYILLNTLNQPDTALIRQQVKGTLFWDLWADLLIKTVASDNQLDVSSLARLQEERTSLVDSLLFEAEVGQLPSLFYLLLTFWDTRHASLSSGTAGSKVREGIMRSINTKFLHLTKIKHTFLNSAHLPMVNPLEISTDFSGYANPTICYVTPYRIKKESKAEKRWGANQHISYQQIDTDLFVDLNVSKSFSHVSGIKYYAGVQYPIGSLVCQIYTGLFETQAAKNVLVIGPESACTKTFDAKSLLIQALAGETEIKIIMDNAARYTLVNRGLAVGIRLLKEVFNAIALQTPCFFLLEDVHLIGDKRLLLISDSSDAKKILNNKMPLSHIDALQVHDKNQVMIEFSKQAVTHYKKPYRDSAEQSIATSQYCFDFFLGNKKKKRNVVPLTGGAKPTHAESMILHTGNLLPMVEGKGKRVKGTSLPSPIPIMSLSLNQSNSTKQKWKPKKVLNEISFEENSKEPEFILVPRINYSVRLKVALLAQHTLSNLSAKVDMITDLLVILDNVRSNKGFVVFATTNRAHRLDPALRRPGRLDETIRVPFLPTASARWEILKSNLGLFFKSTFSPFNVKRSVCLDLIEFTNFSIQINSSLIMSSLPPFYPLARPGLFLPCLPLPACILHSGTVAKVVCFAGLRGLSQDQPLPNKLYLSPKGLVAATSKSFTGVVAPLPQVGKHIRYFNMPKVDLLGDIGSERVKVMAYCKLAKKLILNSTVAMADNIPSSMVAGCANPNSISTNVYLPSVYAKGNTLYWNSITLQEKTFRATEQKNQHFAIVYPEGVATPLQLPGGSQNAKDARSTFLDLERSEGDWEIPQDTTDAALSIWVVKRKLLNLFASKVAESFVCELFCVNQLNQKHAMLPTVENQSLVGGLGVGGLGKKSVGFFRQPYPSGVRNTLTFTACGTHANDWKKASSLIKSFLQKRYMYNKNTIVNSLLCVANGSFVGEFKDEPTNPPHSVILAPSKRYENYKKIFEKHKKKVFVKFSEKVQLHEQQKFIRNLYTLQNSKGDGSNWLLPPPPKPDSFQNGGKDRPNTPGGTILPQVGRTASDKNMKWGQNHMNQGNAGQTFRPGLAVTDPNAKESNLNNSIEGNYSKLSSVSCYYNASIVKRHQFYLTNQWFNGQLAEHNAETVFLSDVDWRLTFIQELGDLSIDFPDADQLYNPRHRRWLLNTSSLSGGTASSWHTFYNYDQEISDHFVMQAYNKIYVLLDKNREQLDALSYKLIKVGFLKELHLVKLVL